MDIELSLDEDGIEHCVKPPIDGSTIITGQTKLPTIGNPHAKIVGEWFGWRSHWLRSAIKRSGKGLGD